LQAFEYLSPTSIAETVALLSNGHGRVRILAGGTDLLVQLREGRAQADLVLDVKRIPELMAVEYDPQQGLRLGAAVPCAQTCAHPAMKAHYPGLVEAFGLIGGVQIQNRASVGGNVCNASPAADATPALIVHRAQCLVAGPGGQRQVPIEAFFSAPGKTVLQPDEFLVALLVPAPEAGFGAHYLRFIPRNEMDIAIVGAGASLALDGAGKVRHARIALGAVAPTPLFAKEAGDSLAGKAPTPENLAHAAQLARQAARPIRDMRGSIEQRQHLAGVLARRALEKALQRAQEARANL
jgi:carbon-monoxide dehydrogenase medium subunit